MKFHFACLLVVLLLVVVGSGVSGLQAAAGRHSASSIFHQYNATIFQLPSQPKLAQWGTLPFHDKVVEEVLFNSRDQMFHLLTSGVDSLVTLPLTAVKGGRIPLETDFLPPAGDSNTFSPGLCRLTAVTNTDFASIVGACNTNAGIYVVPCSWNATASGLACSLLYVTFDWPNPQIHPNLHSIAVQYKGEVADSRQPAKVMIGTDNGLFSLEWGTLVNESVTIRSGVNPPAAQLHNIQLTNTTGFASWSLNVSSLHCLPSDASVNDTSFLGGECYVSTANTFCLHNICPADLVHRVRGNTESYYYRIPGIIDATPRASVYDGHRRAVHFGNVKCDNVLYSNDTLYRVEGLTGGLPVNNITGGSRSLFPASSGEADRIWFSTEAGAVLLQPDWTWKYLNGPRWLPTRDFGHGNRVIAMSSGVDAEGQEVVILCTPTGLSVVQRLAWSLHDKAMLFEEITATRHNRMGLSTTSHLPQWGNWATGINGPTANDGLWSSIYLSAECFRYAATKDPEAKKRAWETFNGMMLLFNVTGIRGYPGRSAQKSATSPGHSWEPSPTMPGWWYWRDTSSDEITGHLGAYPLMHDLVAETPEEKARVAQVITDVTSHIVDNGNDLVGKRGKTLWGRWSVNSTNHNPFYYDGRGLNSVQMLGYLSSAYRITGNTTYKAVFDDLNKKHGFGENMIGAKITQPSDVDFSDDELLYVAYMTLFWSSLPNTTTAPTHTAGAATNSTNNLFNQVQNDLLISLQREFKYIANERSNWWNVATAMIYEGFGLGAQDSHGGMVDDALWCLETWPTSWVTWPTDNSKRLDIALTEHHDNPRSPASMTRILPYDEITLLLWNGSPFKVQAGGGTQEQDPSAWLLPYWMARYAGYITP